VDLEAANKIIAECFAPTIHQMTENTETHSLMGRSDLITSVFFDSTESPGDNWNNLTGFQFQNPSTHDELDPVVYYSVVWTNWAWIISYDFYHPRDYAGGECCVDNHENDLEGAVFVVLRSTEEVIGAYTISHFALIPYDDVTSVPDIFIDNGSHAVEANVGSGCIKDFGNPCDNCKEFSEPHIIYTLSTDGVASVTAAVSTTHSSNLVGTGSYVLEDIFGSHPESLGNHRDNTNVFIENKFVQQGSGCEECSASAPWGWDQFDYTYDDIEFMICSATASTGSCLLINPNLLLPFPVNIEYNPYFPSPLFEYCLDSYTGANIIDQDTEWDTNRQSGSVIISGEATLTIKNCTVEMFAGGSPLRSISLDCGAKLILDNAVIKSTANEKWKGIYLENGASIELKNNSTVKQSGLGIFNNKNLDSYIGPDGTMDPLTLDNISESAGNNSVIIDNSTLEDNFNSLTIDGDNNTIIVRNDSCKVSPRC
jgi:hypothetical protein